MRALAERLGVLGFAAVGAAIGALLFALPPEIPIALAVFGVLVLPVLAFLVATEGGGEARPLIGIFLAAAAVRAVVAITIDYGAPSGFFSLDDGRYQSVGWALSEYWAGVGAYPAYLTERAGYYFWNAFIFTLVGYVPLAVTLSNAAVGATCAVLAYGIAREIGGHRAARVAALLTAFFPSLVLWSSLNLRDAMAVLSILAVIRGTQRLQSSLDPTGALLLLLGVGCLSQLREYLVVIVVLAAVAGIALPRARGIVGPIALLGAFAAAIQLGWVAGSIDGLASGVSFEALDLQRKNLAIGDSVYFADADISTPGAALRFLPIGLAYFLLAPFPWQLWGARQWMTFPEMLAWYALLPYVVIGIRTAVRERFALATPALVFAALATISYALVESNLGTAYRHRAQVLVVYLVFGAVGYCRRRESAETRRRETVPAGACGAAA